MLTEYEYFGLIFSGDFGFYKKRSFLPISVANKRSRRTEVEKNVQFSESILHGCNIIISLGTVQKSVASRYSSWSSNLNFYSK